MNILYLIIAIGGLVFFYSFITVPKFEKYYRQKIISKGVLKEFQKIGFSDTKDTIKGKYNEYNIELNLGWFGHFSEKVLRIHILFKPLANDKESLTEMNQLLRTSYDKKYSWFLNEMTYLIRHNFKTPNFEDIILEIEAMTEILKNEKLISISQRESDKIQSKYHNWQKYIE